MPACQEEGKPVMILTVDEYETIRLIDKKGFSQKQCSEHMKIARTTVQQIYTLARKKLADMLVEGLALKIEGGDYQLCTGTGDFHGCDGCFKYQIRRQYKKPKGEMIMRIAVTFENDEIFQHFGHTKQFKIYDIEDGQVITSQVIDSSGSGHGALAGVLSALNVDMLICGGIGGGARIALESAGIKLYGGASGNADQAVEALLAGTLDFNPNASCSHHGAHHPHDGSCSEHPCSH